MRFGVPRRINTPEALEILQQRAIEYLSCSSYELLMREFTGMLISLMDYKVVSHDGAFQIGVVHIIPKPASNFLLRTFSDPAVMR